MKKLYFLIVLLSVTLPGMYPVSAQNRMAAPEAFFGFKPGADRQLFNYEKMMDYFRLLEKNSGRLKLVRIGTSGFGKPIYAAMISSEQNIRHLNQLKAINKTLALNAKLTEGQREQLIAQAKVFIYATLSMHSNEVGPSQAAPLIAYQLVTTNNPEIRKWLDNVVYMMVPSQNPDGMDMVVQNYLKYRGTRYEGASLPGLFNKYVGHDNNRDFVTLTQPETRAIEGASDTAWYPQVMVEKHQMGSSGVRYVLPADPDPLAMVVDANLWNWMKIFGSNMITDMTADSLKGIAQQYAYDNYRPGASETSLWKNVIAMLTEAASARLATPIYLEPSELKAGGKGLADYKKSINMPAPWKGGWWRLSDIVKYEKASTLTMIHTASLHRKEILKFRNDLCRKEVKKGETQAPYFYLLPLEQHDPGELADLVRIMHLQGIKIYRLTQDVTVNNRIFRRGAVVFPLNQPYRPFIKEVMEIQHYPVRHFTPGGKVIRPYDITSWSLPLNKGLECHEININSAAIRQHLAPVTFPFQPQQPVPATHAWGYVLSANVNQSYHAAFALLRKNIPVYRVLSAFTLSGKEVPAGSFIVKNSKKVAETAGQSGAFPQPLRQKPDVLLQKIEMPRIALMETWFHDKDAGWTRYLFDTYDIPYAVVHPEDVATTDFSNFDVLVFPDMGKAVWLEGKPSESGYAQTNLPPQYTKGIGKSGMEKIMTFVYRGGKVISWGRSVNLFEGTQSAENNKGKTETFVLPYRNVAPLLRQKGLYCPGTFVSESWKPGSPLTYGMLQNSGIFFRGTAVFNTSLPGFDTDRRVIGWFPENKLVMSGYAENIALVAGKANMVWLRKGKGQLILFGFDPVFRASTPVTYKLVFNALLHTNTIP